jgi:hypothetical protein
MERTYSRAGAMQGYALIGILNPPGGALLSAPIRATAVKRAYGSGPVTTRASGLG